MQAEKDRAQRRGSGYIYKCFDQIVRPVVRMVLEKAGMPHGVLRAYMGYIENLEVRNTIAGGLGEAYVRPTSIPQGDPLSMMTVAIVMRAWMVQMEEMNVQPRILADDLQLMAKGEEHLRRFQEAYDATHRHLQDMGARVSGDKCVVWSSCTTSREWLKQHRWRRLGQKVTVENDGRDLGAHYNIARNKRVGTTLTQRMRKSSESVVRLKMKKMPYSKKGQIVKMKLLPKALYACEMAPVNEGALSELRAELANTLTYTTTRRAADLVFAMASGKSDLDPDVEIPHFVLETQWYSFPHALPLDV